MSFYENEEYKEPGYVVEDNVDQDLTDKVKVEKKKLGDMKYELIYTVEDSSGNKAEAKRTVTLKKVEKQDSKEDDEKTETMHSNNGVIYLTFDDGPSLSSTPKILDILKEENVKARRELETKEYLLLVLQELVPQFDHKIKHPQRRYPPAPVPGNR